MKQHNCIGLVLAGGQSSRMGQNKAFLKRDKQTMLEFSQQQLLQAGLTEVLVSGEHSGGLRDLVSNAGPLGGIHAVIQQSPVEALLVLPVDMPLITPKQLSTLKSLGQQTGKAQYFNQTSLPAYIPVTEQLISFLEEQFSSERFLKTGRGPSLRHLFKVIGAHSVPLSNENALFNANTPEQWQHCQQLIES